MILKIKKSLLINVIFILFNSVLYSEVSRLNSIKIIKDDFNYDNYFYSVSPYHNGEFLILSKLLKNNDTFVDVGAYIGEFVLYSSNIFQNLNIIAFEPSPITYFALFNNVMEKRITDIKLLKNSNKANKIEESKELNIFNNKIKINNIGISNHSEVKPFYFNSDEPSISGFFKQYSSWTGKLNKILVKCQTLDDYCLKNNINYINFLKIDTEGSDLNVLLGSENLLKNKQIGIIQFEYLSKKEALNVSLKKICSYLSQFNYRIFKILSDGLVHIEKWRDSLENNIYANFIAVSNMEDENWPVMIF